MADMLEVEHERIFYHCYCGSMRMIANEEFIEIQEQACFFPVGVSTSLCNTVTSWGGGGGGGGVDYQRFTIFEKLKIYNLFCHIHYSR